jgi:beta-lactamase regulating signal transducer with metallopeptidase domain
MTSQIVITYILKTILISGIFLAYYWIALRDKKFHFYNRFYLLTASIMSLVIPLLNFDWFIVEKPVIYSSNEIVQFILPISNVNKSMQFDWIDYSLVIVGIVAITLFSILLLNVIKIQLLKRKSDVTQMDGFDFINTNEDDAPFSFLNNLFWKQSISLQEEGGQQIFKHEITHIQQKHTWDRIYSQIITSIFWMNPFNWVIQEELVTIHEFIADESAVGDSNVEAFAKMLLHTHYGNHFLNPIHQFFYSSIKRRLFMLNQNKKTKYSHLRRLFVLPITICVVLSFSIKTIEAKASAIILEKIENTSIKIQNNNDLLVGDTTKPKKLTPPVPPIPPKPTASKSNKITVTSKTSVDTVVYVNLNYDLNKDKIVVSNVTLSTSKKQAALDALENKANVVITKKTDGGTEKYVIVVNGETASKPNFYLDGVKITEKEMKAISPNDIESVNVLRGEQALKKYPKDGKSGVVEIKLKQKN